MSAGRDSPAHVTQLHDGLEENNSFYFKRANHFVELHDRVVVSTSNDFGICTSDEEGRAQTSVGLLDSLESFLSAFQEDLSTVSGQISELQDRSKAIETRLKARRKIERPLSNLLSDLCIPPPLATLILDTDVGEPWLLAVGDLELRLKALSSRNRVKAARDLAEVAEGLRIVAATKIRAFFMSLFQPIRTSMSTNMQVLQVSVLLKYKPLYLFLQRHAANVAQEIQRAYVAAARVYYETGFRRYTRSLGWIKARSTEKGETIVTSINGGEVESIDEGRLAFAKIDGPGVTLGFMADDKTHKEPLEALFRSLLLVLMDNATAEYTFITAFFSAPVSEPFTSDSLSPMQSPGLVEGRNLAGHPEFEGFTQRPRADSVISAGGFIGKQNISSKEELSALSAIWKQIMDPGLSYCQTFANSILEPPPSVIPLLTMIRLNEAVIVEVNKRECPVLENFVFGLRLRLWPEFQKLMTDHVASVNKLAETATGGYFKRSTALSDAVVQTIVNRYIIIFSSFVILTDQEEETMIFSNLIRLRQELTQLILVQSKKITDSLQSATYQSKMFESLLQAMSKGQLPTIHRKAQTEIAYWREREEEARRRITSTRPKR